MDSTAPSASPPLGPRSHRSSAGAQASSLSAATQGVVAAEVGYLDLAYAYWREAALTDLHDLHNNLHQGLHIASLAGAWNVAVAGFGGMRDHDGQLTFAPRLPPGLSTDVPAQLPGPVPILRHAQRTVPAWVTRTPERHHRLRSRPTETNRASSRRRAPAHLGNRPPVPPARSMQEWP